MILTVISCPWARGGLPGSGRWCSLPAMGTLGAVSVLCVDKTGTVTQNRMTVQRTYAACGGGEQELCETMGRACGDPTRPDGARDAGLLLGLELRVKRCSAAASRRSTHYNG